MKEPEEGATALWLCSAPPVRGSRQEGRGPGTLCPAGESGGGARWGEAGLAWCSEPAEGERGDRGQLRQREKLRRGAGAAPAGAREPEGTMGSVPGAFLQTLLLLSAQSWGAALAGSPCKYRKGSKTCKGAPGL